jgi:hypothetical protein
MRTLLGLALLSVLPGCATPPDVGEASAPLSSRVIREDKGRFIAVEQSDCASAALNYGDIVSANGAWTAPEWVTDATVIMNGYRARYVGNDDHHLRLVSGELRKVVFGADHVLRWSLEGTLQDDDGEHWQEVCWFYTVVGWSQKEISARTHADYQGVDLDYDGLETLLRGNGVLEDTAQPADCPFRDDETVAVIPRGTRHLYTDSLSGRVDHHVLQIGAFVSQDENPGACVTTRSRAVLKDNNTDDHTELRTRVSFLGGSGVHVKGGEDFAITRRSGVSGCLAATGGERVEHVQLTGLGYNYALPMLTGWELAYPCNDEHVIALGASIRNIRYNSCKGTLDYDLVTVLSDEDAWPQHLARHEVTILGFMRDGIFNVPECGFDQGDPPGPDIDRTPKPGQPTLDPALDKVR